jgi:hypothetical protein
VAKVVGSAELAVWEDLSQLDLSGIPKLLGSMNIQTTLNRGQTLIFTINCGEPVGLDLEGMSAR